MPIATANGARPVAPNDQQVIEADEIDTLRPCRVKCGADATGDVRRRLDDVAQRAADGEFSGSELLGGPVVYRYPAVMLPEVQRAVLEAVAPTGCAPMRTLDPFVGSGTTMCEAMLRGFPFVGVDVNPLAILISHVKAGPYHIKAFESSTERVVAAAQRSRRQSLISFPYRDKWYRADVQLQLSRLRSVIEAEPHRPSRRFLWVALAETARLCSNSRLTTVKLHMRTPEQCERELNPIDIFNRVATASLAGLEDWCSDLLGAGALARGNWPRSDVALIQGDIREPGLLEASGKTRFGLVITSPPYGDNRSTIPYGQASYLPSQWVAPADLGRKGVLENPFAIDAISLGASWKGMEALVPRLKDESPTFATVAAALSDQPSDRIKRVASFVGDLSSAIGRISKYLTPDAWQIWTVASRSVGGVRIPLADILIDLQSAHQVNHISTINRKLPSQRRAASRNDRAARMGDEQIIVLRSS